MAKNRRKFTQCPNCGYTFEEVNNYCPNCGQENHDLNVPVKHLIAEFFEGTIHFDTKVWKTLKLLLLKPGLLTEKFNIGQRASYVPPFRLYVFISIVFFFLLALNHSVLNVGGGTTAKIPTENSQQLEQGLQEVDKVAPGIVKTDIIPDSTTSDSTSYKANIRFGSSPQAVFLEQKAEKFFNSGDAGRAKLLKNTSLMMFLLMPFFGYLLYLFYYRQRRNYVEHLMFSIHVHCFVFILLSVIMLLDYVLPAVSLMEWGFVVMIVYVYLAMLRVYKRPYLKTLFKLVPILLIYLVSLTVFFVGTVIISALLV